MREKLRLNGYYNYTVILTYLGMICGFTGIADIMANEYRQALVCLMLAGAFDMFDGMISATKERTINEKRFGIEIDSLSDLICFGVFPAIFCYEISSQSEAVILSGAFYVLCSLIRLAYFNVCEIERQQTEIGNRNSYTGLPVTTIVLILPVLYQMIYYWGLPTIPVCSIILISVAIAFLLPFKLKKPESKGKTGIVITGMIEFAMLVSGVGMRL